MRCFVSSIHQRQLPDGIVLWNNKDLFLLSVSIWPHTILRHYLYQMFAASFRVVNVSTRAARVTSVCHVLKNCSWYTVVTNNKQNTCDLRFYWTCFWPSVVRVTHVHLLIDIYCSSFSKSSHYVFRFKFHFSLSMPYKLRINFITVLQDVLLIIHQSVVFFPHLY